MDEIPITRFKATCLAVLEKVRRTGQPVRITRFGRPIAEVVPSPVESKARIPLGGMEDRFLIVGDIVSPIVAEHEWEVLRGETAAGHSHLDLVAQSPRTPRKKRARRARKPR